MKFLVFSLLTLIALLAVSCSSGSGSQSGNTPTGSPGASSGSPAASAGLLKAVPPVNAVDFLKSFGTVLQSSRDCQFDPKTSIADCTNIGLGKYQVSPPLQHPGFLCHALLNNTTPVGLVCGSATPGVIGAAIYQIQK